MKCVINFSSLPSLDVYAHYCKMKSIKRVKESPSALAFSSSKKRKIISDLVAAQNSIKNKFKQAYADRIKLEQDTKKIFKPITSAIDAFKSKKLKNEQIEDKVKKEQIKDEKVEVNPRRWIASTPKSILHLRKPNMTAFARNIDGTIFRSAVESSADDSDGEDGDRSASAKPSTVSQRKATEDVDLENFTYSLLNEKDYGKNPPDSLKVDVLRTSKASGAKKKLILRWDQLPKSLQRRRLNYLRTTSRALQKSMPDSGESADSNIENVVDTSLPRLRSQAGAERKQYGKSLDFNFIPYNESNRIVYEYFDDPNELCDRLRLLISSRMAGNTNHMQEINSIIEELRELDYIV